MAELFSFFDSTADDPREFAASRFADYFSKVLTNGIFNGGTNLQVGCSGTDINSRISPGYAWIKGYMYKVDADPLALTHALPHATLNRIDRVVLRLDLNIDKRYIKAFILQGTPAASPAPPALTRNGNIYEISLAKVLIVAGKSFIEGPQITDERNDTSVCGLVNSLIQVDTAAMQAQFDAFMAGLSTAGYVTGAQFESHKSDMTAHGVDKIKTDILNTQISLEKSIFALKSSQQAGLLQLKNMAIDSLNDSSNINAAQSSGYLYDSISKKIVATTAPTSGLQSEYKFEDNVNDTSGNSHNGTATSLTYGTGKIGKSAIFNGSSSKVSLGYTAIPATGDFSVSLWIKRKTDTGEANIVGQQSSSSSAGRTNIMCSSTTALGLHGVLGNSDHTATKPIGTWYHAVVSRTGSTLSLYVDNVKQTFTYSGSIEQTTTWLAALNNGSYFGASVEIDQLRFYNRVLTDLEVTQLFNETLDVAGTIIKNGITLSKAYNRAYVCANVTLNGGTVEFAISPNGGSNWISAALETLIDISSISGTNLVLKYVITGSAVVSGDSIGWKDV